MGYVGDDAQLVQKLLCSLPRLRGEHLDGNFIAVLQLSLQNLGQNMSLERKNFSVS
uniref:Uncharacterized protein n=1 Tax=Arundo donax TaxID=35708 RepID=A0A0A9B6I9_ARUDO